MNMIYTTLMKLMLTVILLLAIVVVQAQSNNQSVIKKEIAALDELMSRTEPTSAEFQKAQGIRNDLATQLLPEKTLVGTEEGLDKFIQLLTTINTTEASSAEYAQLKERFVQERPTFDSIKEEQKVMAEKLTAEQYDVWKLLTSQAPQVYKAEK